MLIQFSVKNFMSFKEETILDMTAIPAYKEHEYNLSAISAKEKYLKVAAIYGANASGKSNFYFAFISFKNMIKESLNNVSSEEKKAIEQYYRPFLFDEEQKNIEFEIVLNLKGSEFKYGFEFNKEQIIQEWMYRKDKETNRNAVIFERGQGDFIKFGASVKHACAQYGDQVPQETLFLSFLNRLTLKTNLFKTVYDGIMAIVSLNTNFGGNRKILNSTLPEFIDSEKRELLQFLSAIDSGIKDISYEERDGEKVFFTTHMDCKGRKYPLSLNQESEGTIKSILIYMIAKLVIAEDAALFVDELNVKLHPLLLKFIIDLFYEKKSQAQLIYTTHDTTLLDKKFFRRDQIWFVQKDEFGHSELKALSEYKVRSDASFEKDYLAGVYGGIPFLKDFAWKEGE